MSIDEMAAGLEMDRLVGRLVMGWAEDDQPGVRTWSTGGWWVLDYLDEVEVWNPSENIAHAWEVVERVIQIKPEIFIGRYGDSNLWWANFHEGRCESGSSGAETAPLAICRAALKAMA